MKKALLLCALAASTAVLAATPAHADDFDFTFTGQYYSGSGTIQATLSTPGQYTVTGISGSVNTNSLTTSNIASLLAPGSYLSNDNILYYPGGGTLSGETSYFDGNGLAFSLQNGDEVSLNTFLGFIAPGSTATDGTDSISEFVIETVTPSVAATPEPGSLALLGTAILGGAGVLRRRRFIA